MSATSQRRRRDERGSVTIQMVFLMPALFLLMFLGLQGALYYHAKQVALAAAQEGPRGGQRDRHPRVRSGNGEHLPQPRRRLRRDDVDQRLGVTHHDHRHHHGHGQVPERDSRVARHRLPERQRAGREAHRMTRWTSWRRRRRDERGSVAIEAAIGVPAFGLFIAMIILGGRVEIAKQSVEAAAYEAARAASIERTRARRSAPASPRPPAACTTRACSAPPPTSRSTPPRSTRHWAPPLK